MFSPEKQEAALRHPPIQTLTVRDLIDPPLNRGLFKSQSDWCIFYDDDDVVSLFFLCVIQF